MQRVLFVHCVSGRHTNTWQGLRKSNDAVARQEDTVRTIELVEEAGEVAEEMVFSSGFP